MRNSGWFGLLAVAVMCGLVANGATPPAAKPAEKKQDKPVPTFMGPTSCKMCHKLQSDSSEKTRMAKAMENLKPGAFIEEKKKVGLDPDKDYTSDPTCLGCHTTGYGKPGGYTDMVKTPKLAGVTCEACHGPAKLYLPPMMKKDHKIADLLPLGMVYPGSVKDCQVCHNEKSPFNEKVDAKYKLKYDKDSLTKFVHEHQRYTGDRAVIPGSLFQVKEEPKKEH